MDWGGAISNTAIDAANSVAGAATSAASSDWWSGVSDYATDAFNWIGENPEAANMIGGVVMGGAQAYLAGEQAKDQRAFQREMYDRKQEDRYAKPGEINGYDSHTLTKGLLSNGMIAGG